MPSFTGARVVMNCELTRPKIKMRISFLAQINEKSRDNEPPIVKICDVNPLYSVYRLRERSSGGLLERRRQVW